MQRENENAVLKRLLKLSSYRLSWTDSSERASKYGRKSSISGSWRKDVLKLDSHLFISVLKYEQKPR